MYVQQSQSILFFLRKSKTNKKTGKAPLCVRVKIDGLSKDRVVKGVTLHPDHWDPETKTVKAQEPRAKAYNKKIAQVLTDLSRHIDLVKVKDELATPQAVLTTYETPLKAEKAKEEKAANAAVSEKLDILITAYVRFHKRYFKAYEFAKTIPQMKAARLEQEKKELEQQIEDLDREATRIFDDKTWTKTLALAITIHLLEFMKHIKNAHRSYTTLEKMLGRKKRLLEFVWQRYKKEDMALADLQYKFIEEYKVFNMTVHGLKENSVAKYTQELKECMYRAVRNDWIPSNKFQQFTSVYREPQRQWMTPQQMYQLIVFTFSKPRLAEIRDIYVFEAFTGYSYAELRSAKPEDMRNGIDGKLWLSKLRRKTKGDETLPFLPIALQIVERYKAHPVCLKRGSLLPVPSNEYYNRLLKEIAEETKLDVLLFSHSARYYFANEVLYNNGVQIPTIARAMGQKSVRSAEHYVRPNRTTISESMDKVEKILHNPDGSLKDINAKSNKTAKVISMRAV